MGRSSAEPTTRLERGCCLAGFGGCLGLVITVAVTAGASIAWVAVGVGLGAVILPSMVAVVGRLVFLRGRGRRATASPPAAFGELPMSNPDGSEDPPEVDLALVNAEVIRIGKLVDLYTGDLRAAKRDGRRPSPEFFATAAKYDEASDRWAVVLRRLQAGVPASEQSEFATSFWRASAAMDTALQAARRSVARSSGRDSAR